ncbi:MAG: TetR/AcrR family fatty acid metabolism transcriptional regulator [Crocinitomicaceae bacterium]|jgi:TetR/AcrR family fatty acid metabolism transcriptional regulator
MEFSQRQLEIIDAAGRILTASGVSGLTIKNLASEMKFSESAIYRHFTSKEEIIIALLEYLIQSMDERISNAILIDQKPEDKFTPLFQNQFSFFEKNPHYVVAVFSDGLLEKSKRINETILKVMDVNKKHIQSIILEAQRKNVFTNVITSDEILHITIGAFRLQMFKMESCKLSI